MSFRKDNAAAQTAFRHAALVNGYSPLPNHDKRCFVKGWNNLVADTDKIEEWGGLFAYQATGLRVENGMCAIDIDIDDATLVEELWEQATAKFPQLREALIRYGSGAKEMWICRTDEPFSVIFSTAHVKPDQDPDADNAPAYRLEAFGGGHPRQIGASGAHTLNDAGDGFDVEYTWADNESPAEVELRGLPLLPKSTVLSIAEMASHLLEAASWPRVRRSRSGESALSTAYDLDASMRFVCLDGITRGLDELAEYAQGNRNARCAGSWTGDGTMVNRTRCLVSVDHEGHVSVLETANWTRHMPAELADRERPLAERVTDLREKLEDVGFDFDHDTFHDAPVSFQDVTLRLLDDWAWCGSRGSQCLPVYRQEELAMPLNNLRLTEVRHAYEREGPRGGVIKVNPVDAWLNSSQRQDVDGYRFMPQNGQGVFSTDDGGRAINSYCAPVHDVVDGAAERAEHAQLWEDFLVHLLPDDKEREWFSDWLAHKKQNLTVPAVGIIMYAADFGVGRGSLFEFIGGVFGERYVKDVPADVLMGTSAQGQYTDWIANTLFVTTDEVLPDGEEGTSMAWRRKKAYEKLKERIDPKPRRMNIVRKTLPNYQDWVYASFILATNHNNAIPIPAGDRRLTVLTNGRRTLAHAPSLMRRINRQRNPTLNPRFISVIARWLDERDVSGFNAHVAPDFAGKDQMKDANVNELESTIDDVLAALPYDWTTLDAVLSRVENALTRTGLKEHYPQWRRAATDHVKLRWDFVTRAYLSADRAAKRTVMARTVEASIAYKALDVDTRRSQYKDMLDFEKSASDKMRALRAGLSLAAGGE